MRCAEGMFSFVGSVERVGEYIATKQVYILAKFISSSFLSISLNFSAVSRGPSIDLCYQLLNVDLSDLGFEGEKKNVVLHPNQNFQKEQM